MAKVSMTVNGKKVSADVEDRTLLVHYLREAQGLTGTHVGCDTSQSGACVVHVNGKAVKSCTMLAAQASWATVTTIEGLANGADLHPVQAAFRDVHDALVVHKTAREILAAESMRRDQLEKALPGLPDNFGVFWMEGGNLEAMSATAKAAEVAA